MTALARLVSVLISPEKTFGEVAARPTWAAPLLVLLILGGAASGLAVYKLDPGAQGEAIREQMEERGMSGADLERAVDQGTAVYQRMRPLFPVIGIVFMVAVYLLASAVLWGGVNLAGGETSFLTAWSTTLHGLMPQAVGSLLAIPVLATRETIDPEMAQSGSLLASNLAVLAPEDADLWLRSLLGSIDLFALWSVVLLAIGFRVTARLSKGAAWAVILGCWVAWIAARTGWAALVG